MLFSMISNHELEVVNWELNEISDYVVFMESGRNSVTEVYTVE